MKVPIWKEAEAKFSTITDHYSLAPHNHFVIFETIKLLERPVIMELGVCHGRTSALLAYIAQCREGEYHGIDTFELEGTADEYRAALQALELPFNLHVGSTNGYHPVQPEHRFKACPNWNTPLDVLLIDASHDMPNVQLDCEQWIPHVKPGGIVIFDDWVEGPPGSNHHWGIDYYGNQHTEGWQQLSPPGYKLLIKRRP